MGKRFPATKGEAAAAPLSCSPALIPEASAGRTGLDNHVSKDPPEGPLPHIPPSRV